MSRRRIPLGVCAQLTGAALWPPVLLCWFEHDGTAGGRASWAAISVVSMGTCLLAFGTTNVVLGLRQPRSEPMPSGARIAIVTAILFLGFFALEFSDLLVRQNGKIDYWTNYLFAPALVLFAGLLRRRPWAWRVSRIAAACGVIMFLIAAALIPFGEISRDGIPASWEVRARMMVITILFAAILAGAYRSMGQHETRRYFGTSAEP